MGNVYSSFSSYTFDTIQHKIMCNYDFVLINTLPESEQGCLIKNTIPANKETEFMNALLNKDKKKEIIVYGRNHRDLKVTEKYNQLKKLGFTNVYIYFGGLFEWLLLQIVYKEFNFPIDGTFHEKDLLLYK
jgi:rhodanese-related sulfurtransferase